MQAFLTQDVKFCSILALIKENASFHRSVAVRITFYPAQRLTISLQRTGQRAAGSQARTRHEAMLEIVIWIGIVLCGVAVLGMAEYLRSRGLIRVNGEAIKKALPVAALMLLLGIAGAMAVLFFFLFFLSDYWEYAIVFGGLLFAFLVVRIRRERSFFAPASQGDVSGPDPEQKKGPIPDITSLAMQVGTAVALLVMMVPVLTGGFLVFMFLDFIADKIIGGWPVLLPILAVISFAIYWKIRSRASPPS